MELTRGSGFCAGQQPRTGSTKRNIFTFNFDDIVLELNRDDRVKFDLGLKLKLGEN